MENANIYTANEANGTKIDQLVDALIFESVTGRLKWESYQPMPEESQGCILNKDTVYGRVSLTIMRDENQSEYGDAFSLRLRHGSVYVLLQSEASSIGVDVQNDLKALYFAADDTCRNSPEVDAPNFTMLDEILEAVVLEFGDTSV